MYLDPQDPQNFFKATHPYLRLIYLFILKLKGQYHEIFYHFFLLKSFDLGPMNRQKRFREDIRSQVRKSDVSIVNDYADTQTFLQIQRF